MAYAYFLCFSTWLDSHPDPSGVKHSCSYNPEPLSSQMHGADTSFLQPSEISHQVFTNGLTPPPEPSSIWWIFCGARQKKSIYIYIYIFCLISIFDFPRGIDQREEAPRRSTFLKTELNHQGGGFPQFVFLPFWRHHSSTEAQQESRTAGRQKNRTARRSTAGQQDSRTEGQHERGQLSGLVEPKIWSISICLSIPSSILT